MSDNLNNDLKQLFNYYKINHHAIDEIISAIEDMFEVRLPPADQRAKVIRLCNNLIKREPVRFHHDKKYFYCTMCMQKIKYEDAQIGEILPQIKHEIDCDYLLAKQLFEEFKQ